ncbi:MAG TPA: phospholipase D-like domain-containing protein [Acidimicrobiales bacterium]|jgi:hypothetical protein
MRLRRTTDGLTVRAIAGPHVVLLGMDMPRARTRGLLGFAIQRSGPGGQAGRWLRGFKVFRSQAAGVRPGASVSLRRHPLQSFLWGDYSPRPGLPYRYRVVGLYGTPAAPTIGAETVVDVVTEPTDDGEHAVFFNRGVAGSQGYRQRFGERAPRPDDRSDPAYTWLSRGLEEALLAFVAQATGPRFGLRASVYEFAYPPALAALRAAVDRHADVRIVYDRRGKPSADPAQPRVWQVSEPAIAAAGLGGVMIPRTTNSAISHNKFLVLTEDGAPTQVWTGSTNLTWGGLFGQSNVGHVSRSPAVAAAYLDYWGRLAGDPDYKVLRPGNMAASPDPPPVPPPGVTPVFSPRRGLALIDWYAGLAARAERSFFMTAAFGVHDTIAAALAGESDVLRYLVLEKPQAGVAFDQDVDVKVAVGSFLEDDVLDRWTAEHLTGLNRNVRFSHTKYLLVDPVGDDPLVVTGSGNFSDASVGKNDENMLVIRGDTRVADAYLGEFMRVFNHFYFRWLRQKATRGDDTAWLREDDGWVARYYDPRTPSYRQRLLFR